MANNFKMEYFFPRGWKAFKIPISKMEAALKKTSLPGSSITARAECDNIPALLVSHKNAHVSSKKFT